MPQYDNQENENSISFREFSIKLNGITEIENLNIDLGWDCDVLLYSRNRNISRITGLFVFDIFNNMEPGGKLMHGGRDMVELITKIKKFRVNGNRIGILGRLLGDIFPIPPDPLDQLLNVDHQSDAVRRFSDLPDEPPLPFECPLAFLRFSHVELRVRAKHLIESHAAVVATML